MEAAALLENYLTVWDNLFNRGNLKKNKTLLVHGGTSGIGITALQLAKKFGAHVITTIGSYKKYIFYKKIGIDLVINYKKNDFLKKIKTNNKKNI
nr:zinc-binding dehydrogenase [Candidatus Profftella armatura (Diaphorina cf. continua)]